MLDTTIGKRTSKSSLKLALLMRVANLSLTKVSGHWSEDVKQLIRNLHQEYGSYRKVASLAGVSDKTVRKVVLDLYFEGKKKPGPKPIDCQDRGSWRDSPKDQARVCVATPEHANRPAQASVDGSGLQNCKEDHRPDSSSQRGSLAVGSTLAARAARPVARRLDG